MGRPHTYKTREEKRLAETAKSRQSYAKNKTAINERRRKQYQTAKSDSQAESSNTPEKDAPIQPAPCIERETVAFWSTKLDDMVARVDKLVAGKSHYRYMDALYTQYATTNDPAHIFDHIMYLTKIQQKTREYCSQITQLQGEGACSDMGDCVQADMLKDELSMLLGALEDLGLATSTNNAVDYHASKQLWYQSFPRAL
ncbi:hypothetical protein DXG01_013845 [Tephrocybe rancida]|nr:hypothetical protein DXG01_013845 [Tephrocybe rancida]